MRQVAPRGIDLNCVVIADDENLEIASGLGFQTLELPNDSLGRKVNAGIEYAAHEGADFIAFVGSDDWVHEDLFDGMDDEAVMAGRRIALCDLRSERLKILHSRGRHGVIPWLIPRFALERSGFRPLHDAKGRGIDLDLALALGRKVPWVFHDPHDFARVDFKSDVNLTPYDITYAGFTPDFSPWQGLRDHYSPALVDLAENTARSLSGRS